MVTYQSTKQPPARFLSRLGSLMPLLAIMPTFLVGCTADSWFDPSVVGRWETTPAIAPIIDRLDVVEPAEKDFVETSSVSAGDLIPDIQAYLIGESDTLLIEIFELFDPGVPYIFQRNVGDTGYISVPLIGPVYVSGISESEAQRLIADRLSPDILRDPQVSVIAQNKTQNRFSVSGPAGAGLLDIPHPRFRLTDALASYGSTPDGADNIFIIRQIPLDESVIRGTSGLRPPSINDNSEPGAPGIKPGMNENDDGKEPADEKGDSSASGQKKDDVDLGNLIDELTDDRASSGTNPPDDPKGPDQVEQEKGGQSASKEAQPALQIPKPGEGTDAQAPSRWVYLNGKWVRVAGGGVEEAVAETEPFDLVTDVDISKLVTQRVIKIPVKPLLEGVAAYNIVIRPNDIIRIPSPESGLIYLQGEIARPGSYNLPPIGRHTLIRAVAGAGGLAPLAIPERVDIIRMLPNNRQATVRVNFRAIYEMTEPDIYLKPGDVINIGTTWYAAPLAVIRNGFRTSYGFGFLLDRNFGNDVFGAPPSNNNTNR